jgi:hypothetical protein
MKRKNESTARTPGGLQRLTDLARAGNARAWPWDELRSRHFRAPTDEASQRKLAEWARKNDIVWNLQPETVRVGRSRRELRVVVLLEPRERAAQTAERDSSLASSLRVPTKRARNKPAS